MAGDEPGLEAYFPFDGVKEVNGILDREANLVDATGNQFDLSLGGKTTENYSEDAPPVKLPRLVEKVNYTYSINNDRSFTSLIFSLSSTLNW